MVMFAPGLQLPPMAAPVCVLSLTSGVDTRL
ncbi:hypothetical protein CLV67_11528 [Actinoplanes italicus]|uniref:Uncharacterized protein n=1 Tax=Actinoplanes italicus TaxID=113567 RepID=A0A2T0K499_9ACTN|nr:hypothetical protein CLV67_11528 [Actinoplanes italicus]